jgi:hypothetical protein
MITPTLEKAILSGLAQMHNYPVGGAAVNRIAVPEDHVAFLVGFSYYPNVSPSSFNDDPNTAIGIQDRNVFQEVDFYSANVTRKWVFKTQMLIMPSNGSNHLFQALPGEFKVECLVEFTKDIYVEFKSPQVGNATGGDTGALLNNQDPGLYTVNSGEGYGNTIPAVKRIDYITGRKYYPAGIDNGTTSPANRLDYETIAGINDVFQPIEQYQNGVSLGPTGYNTVESSINVTLVFINKQYRDQLVK